MMSDCGGPSTSNSSSGCSAVSHVIQTRIYILTDDTDINICDQIFEKCQKYIYNYDTHSAEFLRWWQFSMDLVAFEM